MLWWFLTKIRLVIAEILGDQFCDLAETRLPLPLLSSLEIS